MQSQESNCNRAVPYLANLRSVGANISVQIFEASTFANEVGAAITLAPNCALLLQALGVDVHRMRGVELRGVCPSMI